MTFCRTFALGLLFAVLTISAAETPFRWERTLREIRCYGAPGCYLYAEATHINAKRADGSEILFTAPEAEEHDDGLFGKQLIYPAKNSPWIWQAKEPLPDIVTVEFQGCRAAASPEEPALCYPPEKAELTASKTSEKVTETVGILPEKVTEVLRHFHTVSVQSGLLNANELYSWIKICKSDGKVTDNFVILEKTQLEGFLAILFLVVLGGLGLNFTPCVLPMIPINLALIGAGVHANKWQGFRRGTAYALGIALTYGALGIPAALSGAQFGAINSNYLFNFLIAVLFAVLSLGMFGVYELDFSRYGAHLGGKRGARGYLAELSAFGMGAVAALLAGACVAPVVITVLVLAAKLYAEGHVWGALLPLALGVSMALPWPLAGMGLAVLPKPGAWMFKVKIALGIFIAALAIYYAVSGIKLLPGFFNQSREIDRLAAELQDAATKRETVLLDFTASWCKNCAALKRTMETDEVKATLKNVRVIAFRAERLTDPAVKALLQNWNLPGLPSLVLLAPAEQIQ